MDFGAASFVTRTSELHRRAFLYRCLNNYRSVLQETLKQIPMPRPTAEGAPQMHLKVRADDGDQVLVTLDDMALEQAVVRLLLENNTFPCVPEFESIALSAVQARELGRALLIAADVLDSAISGGSVRKSGGTPKKPRAASH
jgi:hypothetical protein